MRNTPPAGADVPRVAFDGGGALYTELKASVREYLGRPGVERRALRALHVKSISIALWAIASWVLLVFFATNWWQALVLAVSLGLAVAGLGFCVAHDANHGAFSTRPWVTKLVQWSLDVIGGSSYVWRIKHNVVHHTYTNVAGIDADIEVMPLARFAPEQELRSYHRWQHLYMWPLYGLVTLQWQIAGDFRYLAKGDIGGTPVPWPKGKALAGFWLGKVAFVSWALVIPMLFHPWWAVILLFLLGSLVLAETLAITFQLAHCLEEAAFPSRADLTGDERSEWARHQVETTVDFAPGNRFLTWYMGGLNYQIEHHLFSRICHVHYPAIAPIVADVCRRHGVKYESHRTLAGALGSHQRWLRRMARPEPGSADAYPPPSSGVTAPS